ncbi:MAG: universal stress protein [Deltaproteobacteria bacterium]|nr:universal stress protein [Deltaproteobacteria bacterium]
MHWKTILVPHDFSSSANHAAALARDEAKLHGGTIVLLHVVDLPRQLPQNAVIPTDSGAQLSVKDYATQSAQAHLEDLSARLAKDGVTATTAVRLGNAVDEINRYVDENSVSLIVMGTHGHTGIRAMLAGSVTEKVVRSAKVPVLTVRHPE